jgi:glycosyltransferase involved in cell wall biosynthesis
MATKGVFLVLEAFKILQGENKNIHLHIAGAVLGDDELSSQQTEKALQGFLKSMDGVSFHGTVTGSNKVALLNKSAVFLLPSYYKSEAVPLSIIEAMASGCGVICSKHNYLPSLISDHNGILVEPRDVNSLVQAMRCYVLDRAKLKFHQENNRRLALDNFSEKEYLRRLEKILLDALGSARAGRV